ncbi:mitochondrial carrier [Vararia minispora EC-137]|uniref:Mitochondrial carrier n=1 Tax=Vararia minispora EC-137 TaxID=1314806 RepID=A0ACB8QY28_9AGAM|nr:mitochondrial carrier [Vararia minispora EC-137]
MASSSRSQPRPDPPQPPSNRDTFEAVLKGAQDRPLIPHLRSDPPADQPEPNGLDDFRKREGREHRKAQLRELWHQLPRLIQDAANADTGDGTSAKAKASEPLTREDARRLRQAYVRELLGSCSAPAGQRPPDNIGWTEFKEYALQKEEELWCIFHDELDLDGNGRLEASELALALRKAGIELTPTTLSDFMTYLTASPHSHAISFREFRDFLLLLPRKVNTREIYRFYQVRKFLGDDGRGPARVTMEGDVTLSAEDKPPDAKVGTRGAALPIQAADNDEGHDDHEDDGHGQKHFLEGYTALRYLLAGGIAGAVSRTCTAPFDRLKIFLMTRSPDLGGLKPGTPLQGLSAITGAVVRIYAEGGVLGFWVGNGLSVAKIFPESAIKFFSYESSKRFFAKYVDHVEDTREISGSSRFISGGMGGISSQLSIYPVETLKTQMMSSTGETKRTLMQAAKHVWALGGLRAYYRGLGIGLVGVFPYSAIDMSTFEALKLAYLKSTGKDEPGVLALLMFGSISGSVGASMVYPLNLVRTRMQASGSSGHPERYTGIRDVIAKTYQRDGWKGFYRGLFPTLAKVVPAVSISYVVYEQSKRRLGVS